MIFFSFKPRIYPHYIRDPNIGCFHLVLLYTGLHLHFSAMVGPPYDILANPLGAVRSLFHRHCDDAKLNGTVHPADDCLRELGSGDWGIRGLVNDFLQQPGAIQRVSDLRMDTYQWIKLLVVSFN